MKVKLKQELTSELKEKLAKLKIELKAMGKVIIAFSGGVDSTFLTKVATEVLGKNAIAVTAYSPSVPEKDFRDAIRVAKLIGAKHKVINTYELDNENYKQNPSNRCYFCKSELYNNLHKLAKEWGIKYILDGTNYDDLSDYRPGMEAAIEHKIRSPLKDLRFTKHDIRQLLKFYNISTYNKPSSPCLSSRIPYGKEITFQKLRMIDSAESFLKDLGFKEFRVRHHDDIARIEVKTEDIMQIISNKDIIDKRFKEIGFKFITLDLRDFKSGSLNNALIKEPVIKLSEVK